MGIPAPSWAVGDWPVRSGWDGRTGVGRPDGRTLYLMRTLYMATSGAADPTRASIPLHLAVNGSLEVGHTAGIVLAGDATELVKAAVESRGCWCTTSPRPARQGPPA